MAYKLLPIFAYGILRKESMLNQLLEKFDIESVELKAERITGFVPYSSGMINILFPVTDKQRQKYPNAKFHVWGTVLTFTGEQENLYDLYNYIDAIEGSYHKQIVLTESGEEVYVYTMEGNAKKYLSLNGMGLIIYPDSILKDDVIYHPQMLSEED